MCGAGAVVSWLFLKKKDRNITRRRDSQLAQFFFAGIARNKNATQSKPTPPLFSFDILPRVLRQVVAMPHPRYHAEAYTAAVGDLKAKLQVRQPPCHPLTSSSSRRRAPRFLPLEFSPLRNYNPTRVPFLCGFVFARLLGVLVACALLRSRMACARCVLVRCGG